VDAALDQHGATLRTHGFYHLRVKRIVDETADTRTFTLEVPCDVRAAFAYRPGQFCTFRVGIDGTEHLRSYSMCSAPETDTDLAVTVKRVPGGLVSNWLNDRLAMGDVVDVTAPAGIFCPRDTESPVVGFCGGSGITPLMSITKSVLATSARQVRILYANRDPGSVIFDQALRQLGGRHGDRLEVRYHFDSESGLPGAEGIAPFAEGGLDADFYICGPGPFMDLVSSTLLGLGVEPVRVLIERFNVDPAPAQPKRVGPAPVERPAGGVTEQVTLILKGKPTTVSYQTGDTVLETARRAGLRPPYSCEAGNCATCMAFLREGTVIMRANNALTPVEVEEGWVLTCQSVPTSSKLTIEYESL